MKEERDPIHDISDIRSMMERSTKFLSLSGWAGVLAGVYALSGAFIAYRFLGFNPGEVITDPLLPQSNSFSLLPVVITAILILVLAVITAVYFSYKNAGKRGEKLWNATSRRLLANMAVPLVAGGILVLILLSKGFIGFMAPFTLIFYGLALYNASKFTFEAVKFLGLIQISLGLLGSYFVSHGLLFWALGFGVAHIVYGIYIYYRYEK